MGRGMREGATRRGRTPGLPPRGVRPRLAPAFEQRRSRPDCVRQRGPFRSTCGTSLRKARLELETRNSRGRTAHLPPAPRPRGVVGPHAPVAWAPGTWALRASTLGSTTDGFGRNDLGLLPRRAPRPRPGAGKRRAGEPSAAGERTGASPGRGGPRGRPGGAADLAARRRRHHQPPPAASAASPRNRPSGEASASGGDRWVGGSAAAGHEVDRGVGAGQAQVVPREPGPAGR